MSALSARNILGNLAYCDTHRNRIVEAFGAGVCKFVENFVGSPFASANHLAGWTTTLVEAGAGSTTVTLADEAGGALLITTDNAENDGANLQALGEAFKLATGKPCYFGCRFKVSDATQSDFLVGLCITDPDLLGGLTDGAYFRKVDGSTSVSLVLEKNSAETTGVVHTMVNDTYVILEWMFDGTNLDSWVNGVLQTRLAMTNLPDDEELTPSIHVLTGEAGIKALRVDWIRAIQFNG